MVKKNSESIIYLVIIEKCTSGVCVSKYDTGLQEFKHIINSLNTVHVYAHGI